MSVIFHHNLLPWDIWSEYVIGDHHSQMWLVLGKGIDAGQAVLKDDKYQSTRTIVINITDILSLLC